MDRRLVRLIEDPQGYYRCEPVNDPSRDIIFGYPARKVFEDIDLFNELREQYGHDQVTLGICISAGGKKFPHGEPAVVATVRDWFKAQMASHEPVKFVDNPKKPLVVESKTIPYETRQLPFPFSRDPVRIGKPWLIDNHGKEVTRLAEYLNGGHNR